MHASWNSAAEAAVKEIFAVEVHPRSVQALRAHLDGLIERFLPSGGDVVSGGSEEVRAGWIELGRTARALGSNIDFLNSSAAFGSNHQHVLDIVLRKQHDYGHENIARFGRMGLLVRVHDKIARLENLLGTGSSPNNESIEDNIVDVIGYSTVAAMWEEGTFLLALLPSTVVESEPVSTLDAGNIGFLRLA